MKKSSSAQSLRTRIIACLLALLMCCAFLGGCQQTVNDAQALASQTRAASSATKTPAATPEKSVDVSASAKAVTPTATKTPTPSPSATEEPSSSPSETASPTPSETPEASPSPSETASPSPSPSPEATAEAAPLAAGSQTVPVVMYGTGSPYMLAVDITNQIVTAWGLDEAGTYSVLAHRMICSSGLGDSTPLGTFTMNGDGYRWAYFQKWTVWAQYVTRIVGSIWFHSVLFSKADESTLRVGSFYNLGKKASHGCIRLQVADAKWIFDNCPSGTQVYVYEGAANEPLRQALLPSGNGTSSSGSSGSGTSSGGGSAATVAPTPTATPYVEPTPSEESTQDFEVLPGRGTMPDSDHNIFPEQTPDRFSSRT